MDRKSQSPDLEEGEILDDDPEIQTVYQYFPAQNGVNRRPSSSSTGNQANETGREDEKELDRIIHDFQEEFSSKDTKVQKDETLNSDDEEALRLALIAATKKKKKPMEAFQDSVVQEPYSSEVACCSHENNLASSFGTQADSTFVLQEGLVSPKPKVKSTWVPLMKKKIRSSRASITNRDMEPLPLTVTVINEGCLERKNAADVETSNRTLLENLNIESQGYAFAGDTSIGPCGAVEAFNENEINAALHNIRLNVESKHFGESAVNSKGDDDNYDQIGMDIADSDREAQSRPVSRHSYRADVQVKEKTEGNRSTLLFENDDDTEALRAALLAQVQKTRHAVAEKDRLEEGEIVGDVYENGVPEKLASEARSRDAKVSGDPVTGSDNKVSRPETKKADSLVQVKSSDVKDNSAQKINARKRHYGRRSQSSENTPEGASVDMSPTKRRRFGRHGHRKSRGEEIAESKSWPKSLEEWDLLIEKEAKERKIAERKIERAEAQREDNIRRRDQYLEKASILSHSIGTLDAEVMKYKSNLEHIKGRSASFQKERERLDKSLREAKRFAEKEKKREEKLREKQLARELRVVDGQADGDSTLLFGSTLQQTAAVPEQTAAVVQQAFIGSLRPETRTEAHHEEPKSDRICEGKRLVEKPAETEEYLSSSTSPSPSEENAVEDTTIQLSESEKDSQDAVIITRDLPEVLPSTASELENKENIENFHGVSRQHLKGNVLSYFHSRIPFSEESIRELKNNPLIMFSGYRLCRSFPLPLITHPAISNKLDPLRPLCYYQLCGKCMDSSCRWQHESDYVMTDEEVICSVLAHCPSLCPPDKMFSDYAREILMQRSPRPVSEVVGELLSRLPESDRTISACEMAAKCDLPREDFDEDSYVEYEISPCFAGLILGDEWIG